jgi:hypothetical protein
LVGLDALPHRHIHAPPFIGMWWEAHIEWCGWLMLMSSKKTFALIISVKIYNMFLLSAPLWFVVRCWSCAFHWFQVSTLWVTAFCFCNHFILNNLSFDFQSFSKMRWNFQRWLEHWMEMKTLIFQV